jgi:AraC family transcriptional regulator
MSSSAEINLNQIAPHLPATESLGERRRAEWLHPESIVSYSPSKIVKRHSAAWSGLMVETVQAVQHKPFENRSQAPCHLLMVFELGERYDGETLVEGLPPSTLRNFTRKMTFVPSGYDFRASQKPRALTRTILFYIDPRGPLADPDLRFAEIEFKPRLYFHNRDLWETALKLKSQVENSGSRHRQYAEALGILLTHELIGIGSDAIPRRSVSRGGLASWQQKCVADYIEEHVADNIPLLTLAELARLSPYHFCRSFKQSFGMPAHKYHVSRRIERAKRLLGNRELSITAIALKIGFNDTSTFSTTFHRLTGVTPSCYRSHLD